MAHVLVCGLGEVGYRTATLLLDLGEQVTVVSVNPPDEWKRILEGRGARVFTGDARDEQCLEQAGLKDADAVLACTHNDGANIEIALDVRKLYPDKRTVARIVDPSLARQSERHLGVHRAISMTAAAAPTFAAATYGDDVLTEFNIGEARFLAIQLEGPQHLKEKPLVVINSAGQCHQHEGKELKEGESAVVIIRAESIKNQIPQQKPHHSMMRALHPRSVFQFAKGVWHNTSVQLRAVLIVILSLIVVSVVVFDLGMNLSPIDALYFVVTTATTTGYGDISPKDASAWLKVYTCFMMVVSATGLAVLFSIVTDYILTARLMQLVGRHHIPDHGHILVVGVGNAGHRVVEELVRLKAPVVAIDRFEDGEFLSTLRPKVHVVIGDGRDPETLRRAGARHASAIIVITNSDAVNLGIGLTAKEINPEIRVVLCILDSDFAAKVQGIAHIDVALSPPMLAAPAFAGCALYPGAVASFRLDGNMFTLVEDEKGDVELAGKRMTLQSRELLGPKFAAP